MNFKLSLKIILQNIFYHSESLICGYCDEKLKEYAVFKHKIGIAQNKLLSANLIKEEDSIKKEPPEDVTNHLYEDISSPEIHSFSSKLIKKVKSNKRKDPKNDHFCPLCDKFFTESRKVKAHIERIHMKKKNFKCDLCDYTAYKKYDIHLHFCNIHTPKDKLINNSTCPDCGLSFQTNSKLNMHIQRKHQNFKRFGCDLCSLRTTTLNEMRIHVKTHMAKDLRESYSCNFCNAVFYSKGSLKNHKDVKHDVNKREYVCFCGKIFRLKSVYQRHFNVVHMGEKKFKCDQCSKSFAVRIHLENHQQAIHTIQTGIACEKCGLVLKNKETLKKHLIYHNPPKFQCSTCFKMFHENKKLQDHQSAHTTLEFSCSYCSQSYRLESQLSRHIKRVHIKEKTTFRCELCLSTFTRKSTYRDHVLRQHKELTGDVLAEFLLKVRKSIPEEYKS